jgi:DNA gyrase subunit A
MLVTDRGQTIRTRVDEIRETGRNAQGVRLMSLEDGERIVGCERLAEKDEEPPVEGAEAPAAEGSEAADGSDAGPDPSLN